MIYLFFLTGYALNIITDKYVCKKFNVNVTTQSNGSYGGVPVTQISSTPSRNDCACVKVFNYDYENIPSRESRRFYVDYGKYAVLFLAVCSLIIEVCIDSFLSFYPLPLPAQWAKSPKKQSEEVCFC